MKKFIGDFIYFQAAKICNNMLLAISMVGTAETMNLGIRLAESFSILFILDTSCAIKP